MSQVTTPNIPLSHYGVLERKQAGSAQDLVIEQVLTLGYSVLEASYSAHEMDHISATFDLAYNQYVGTHGKSVLEKLDESNTMRAMLTWSDPVFAQLALNPLLLSTIERLIKGKFILNQQNGIINPPGARYNQGAWHRDFPYQHFVSSRPIAINALFCVDDFTADNGATFVLPASHKSEPFASQAYIEKNSVQITAKAGTFILLDCMLYHTGGFNQSQQARRAINHVFNIPYFKQQINIPLNLDPTGLSAEAKELFGFEYQEPPSVAAFFEKRKGRSA